MSYSRVIPRDLFNEANLLKCMGRLWINVENAAADSPCRHIAIEHEGVAFDIRQSDCDGSIAVRNIAVSIYGNALNLRRPLNSRDAWPLWLDDVNLSGGFDPVEVFNDEGDFSADFVEACRALLP